MPNLQELTENQEFMEQEAEKFADLCAEPENAEPWDQGPGAISAPEQLCALLDRIGRGDPEEYRRFCEIGADDF